MGEAKRRKLVDKSYGKVPKNTAYITLADFALPVFKKFGKGVFVWVNSEPLEYHLFRCGELLETERELLQDYNPFNEVVMTFENPDNLSTWYTAIFSLTDLKENMDLPPFGKCSVDIFDEVCLDFCNNISLNGKRNFKNKRFATTMTKTERK